MNKRDERLLRLIKKAQEEYADDYLVFAIPGFMSKKFIAYCAMKEDIELILKYIDLLRGKPANEIESALSYSMISLYGKCFTDASKKSFPKLESSNLFSGNADLLETHNYLMDLRHQFIAHRGETESEIGIAYMIMPKAGAGKDKNQIRFSQVKQRTFSPDDLDKFEKLMQFIHSWLLEKIQKTGQKLYEAFLKLYSPEEIAKTMLINNAK